MKQSGISKEVKAVQYSLILTLELDFNSKEEKLFNKCIDSLVKTDSKYYCTSIVMPSSDLSLWSLTD
jgi:hypothetical protein